MNNKEDVIAYLKEHKEDIYDVCEEFNLHIDFYDSESIKKQHETLKEVRDYWFKKFQENKSDKNRKQYHKLRDKVEEFEKLYHIFEPNFDKMWEKEMIPESFNDKAHKIFEYRKEMYQTQSIYKDMLLDSVICADEGETWNKMDGQDGMYENFPFTISYKSVVDEHDYVNPYYKPDVPYYDVKVYHYKTEMIRSYCLNSSGGLAIVEIITHTTYDDKPEEYTNSHFQILTLGEDDGNHFLNSTRIYEEIWDGKDEDFLKMLNMVIDEYKKFKNI